MLHFLMGRKSLFLKYKLNYVYIVWKKTHHFFRKILDFENRETVTYLILENVSKSSRDDDSTL